METLSRHHHPGLSQKQVKMAHQPTQSALLICTAQVMMDQARQ